MATLHWRFTGTPIAIDHHGSQLVPLVITRSDIPMIVDEAWARAEPDLAAIALLAHGHGPHGKAIARAMLLACRGLDEVRARLDTDLVFVVLDEPARRALEAEMNLEHHEYPVALARHFIHEGEVKGRAEALLDVLEARGFPIDDALRAKVTRCGDADRLRTWLARATKADDLRTIFDA